MGFEDLDDLSELDEMPPFEEDLSLPGFEDAGGGGGVSRTFKIIGAFMVLAVIGVVGVLLFVLLQGDDEISGFDQTSTAIKQTNDAVVVAGNSTGTAAILAFEATRNYIQTQDYYGTVTAEVQATGAVMTQTSVAATEIAGQMTASAQANEAATQTAQANATATQVAREHSITGQIVGANDQPIEASIPLFLYRDNGDGVFVPPSTPPAVPEVVLPGEESDEVPSVVLPGGEEATEPETEPGTEAATEPAGEAATEAPSDSAGEPPADATEEPTPIFPGQTVSGSIEMGDTLRWSFEGTAGDSVSITAASDTTDLQVTLRLLGPDETEITMMGPAANVSLAANLLTTGPQIIEMTSIAGTGSFTLDLILSPGDGTPESENPVSYAPELNGAKIDGIVLVGYRSQGATPTPEDSDEFITSITTNPDGTFNFEALEEGTYYLVIDPATLTPVQLEQLGIPEGSGPVVVQVVIPGIGEPITFNVLPTPTPTAGTPGFVQTMTAMARLNTGTPATATPTSDGSPQPSATLTPTALSTTGGFDGSFISGSGGLTVLAIAAAGLLGVVFVARKLRTAA